MYQCPIILSLACRARVAIWVALWGMVMVVVPPPQAADKLPEPSFGQKTDYAPVVAKVAPSVVTIYTSRTVKSTEGSDLSADAPFASRLFGQEGHSQKLQGLGSGVIVSADGLILTSNHVIDGADQILVGFGAEKREHKATKIGSDPGTDLALLKIDGKDLPALDLADSDQVRAGQIVLAMGSPFGLTQTVTMGIISATGRGGLGIIDIENFIQTDAAINVGNSGGALVDTEGRLVGINSAILSRTGAYQGIGFAIPSNLARDVMPSLREKGRVVRGYIGTLLQPLTPELSAALKLNEQSGALVGEVAPKSPAEKAGIKSGDVITAVNDKRILDTRELRLMIGAMAPGTKAKFQVVREDGKKSFDVDLTETPSGPPESAAASDQKPPLQMANVFGGVLIADIDDDVRQVLNAPKDIQGTVIIEIDPSSSAARAGLRRGDVIREFNKHTVKSAKELVIGSQALKPGEKALLQVWSEGKSGYIALERP